MKNTLWEGGRASHDAVARRTKAAIGEMLANGERVSFYSVAARAQVARSTLYRRADLRKLIEDARGDESATLSNALAAAKIADLEEELARVRRERDKLMRAMAEAKPIEYRFVQLEAVA